MSDAVTLRELEISVDVSTDAGLILQRLTLRLREGNRLALLGRSGMGKTLFLKSLTGNLPEGFRMCMSVRSCEDRRLQESTVQQSARKTIMPELWRMAYLPQSGGMVPPHMSVGEVAADLGKRWNVVQEEIGRVFEDVGLSAKTVFPRRPASFSGGELRRITLALSLISKPSLLVLDEPTAGLDHPRIAEIAELLLKRNETILFATHDPLFARRIAHEVAFIEHGRCSEQRNSESFFREPQSVGAQRYLEAWDTILGEEWRMYD